MPFEDLQHAYSFVIRHHPRLTKGQKEQCFSFLSNYKDGIAVCERYIAITLGEIIVVTEQRPSFGKQLQALLLLRPGLTVREITQAMGCHHTSISNSLGKGLRRGRFIKKGDKFYAA